jgi:trehalose 6-phosphate synthase
VKEFSSEGDIIRRSVIIASNRGPVTFHQEADGELTFQRGSGGLVTALTGLIQHIDASWISCAISEVDNKWRAGKISLTENKDEIFLKFISPEEDVYEGYYNVIANPLLWFLQHSMWNVPYVPVITKDTWKAWEEGYVAVNRMFAQAVIERLRHMPGPVLVMLQDYHLYLAAHELRSRIPPRQRPTILHFTHIPWPGPEYWGMLPPNMRHSILEGMCGADVLGFQTNEDALNFIRTCETYLPQASTNYKKRRIWYRNHATHVRDFPISIDVTALKELANSAEVGEYRSEIQDIVGDRKLVLRIDRIEPSKNIVRGFQAFEEFLDLHPEFCEQVTFLALLVPSRMDVEQYHEYLDVLMAAAGQVNANYGTPDWEPIRIMVGENYPRAIAALKHYDVLMVNAIADGMNLVAKEGPIVNQRDGVLMLSERAGARQQLASGSIVIPPCDIFATAQAIHQAFAQPAEERRVNAERLRWLIERDDIDAWLRQQLDTVSELNL